MQEIREKTRAETKRCDRGTNMDICLTNNKVGQQEYHRKISAKTIKTNKYDCD
jgi:hypothetical protein